MILFLRCTEHTVNQGMVNDFTQIQQEVDLAWNGTQHQFNLFCKVCLTDLIQNKTFQNSAEFE